MIFGQSRASLSFALRDLARCGEKSAAEVAGSVGTDLGAQVLDAWGFKDKTILTWVKDKMGTGDWLRGQTEHVIMAVRGKPTVTLTNQTTVLHAPARGHSVKPVEFYDFVEKLCPAPRYTDIFSRYQHNEKWDCHGDEAPMSEAAD